MQLLLNVPARPLLAHHNKLENQPMQRTNENPTASKLGPAAVVLPTASPATLPWLGCAACVNNSFCNYFHAEMPSRQIVFLKNRASRLQFASSNFFRRSCPLTCIRTQQGYMPTAKNKRPANWSQQELLGVWCRRLHFLHFGLVVKLPCLEFWQ